MKGYSIKIVPILFGILLSHLTLDPQKALLANQQTSQQIQAESLHVDKNVQKNIQKHVQQAQKATQEAIIPEAVAAIEETKKALDILAKAGGEKEAFAAIERAIGKISVLLARHENTALLPIDVKLKVEDNAPLDIKKIRELSQNVTRAVEDRHFAESRVLLKFLESEIHVHTKCLPLAVYPVALAEAAHLLEQGNREEAQRVLSNALTTLATIHQAIPISLIKIQTWLEQAAEKHQADPNLALQLISNMEQELERGRELGYLVDAKDYAQLHKEIKELEKHIKSHKSSPTIFVALKEKIEEMLKRLSLKR